MNQKVEQAKRFKTINEFALKHEKVIFGTVNASNIMLLDISNNSRCDYVVYNRCIEGLTINDAIESYNDSLKYLSPSNILLSFIKEDNVSVDEYIESYKKLLDGIMLKNPFSKICVLCLDQDDETINQLGTLCKKEKINIILSKNNLNESKKIFSQISAFFRNGFISFSDAFTC